MFDLIASLNNSSEMVAVNEEAGKSTVKSKQQQFRRFVRTIMHTIDDDDDKW